jgi:Protein of unknown function (DUF3891)
MIIRRFASSLQLITQPAHAALSALIMRQWGPAHFPDSPRKASILNAIEQHDCGWAAADEALVLDEKTGQLLDFTEVPDTVKHETSVRGIEPLSSDPYAAALAAQHRLHVYRRYADQPEWTAFFAKMTAARDAFLRAAGADSLDQLLQDYRFVRAGDLASLAFCNNWADTADDGSGYSMHFDGTVLGIVPDPLDGRTLEIDIEARVIDAQRFGSPEDARRVVASAPVVRLSGVVSSVTSGCAPAVRDPIPGRFSPH